MTREDIALDILEYSKARNMRYFTTRYEAGKVINSRTGKHYTSHELANGNRHLHKVGAIKRVSKNRWEFITYELEVS